MQKTPREFVRIRKALGRSFSDRRPSRGFTLLHSFALEYYFLHKDIKFKKSESLYIFLMQQSPFAGMTNGKVKEITMLNNSGQSSFFFWLHNTISIGFNACLAMTVSLLHIMWIPTCAGRHYYVDRKMHVRDSFFAILIPSFVIPSTAGIHILWALYEAIVTIITQVSAFNMTKGRFCLGFMDPRPCAKDDNIKGKKEKNFNIFRSMQQCHTQITKKEISFTW